jgi:hypothetical protein
VECRNDADADADADAGPGAEDGCRLHWGGAHDQGMMASRARMIGSHVWGRRPSGHVAGQIWRRPQEHVLLPSRQGDGRASGNRKGPTTAVLTESEKLSRHLVVYSFEVPSHLFRGGKFGPQPEFDDAKR